MDNNNEMLEEVKVIAASCRVIAVFVAMWVVFDWLDRILN